jgi:LuxR family maltose regulon positive regulatory protein
MLVSAPAGYGKTTALSHWARKSKKPVSWVSLDESDNDPVRFWAYFINALQTVQPGIGEASLAQLSSPRTPPIDAILSLLLNEVSDGSQQFFIVLDDYHLIRNETIHDSLGFLLDHLPLQMHLIVATRVDPALPLDRLRVRNQLAEIRTADFRFPAVEATAFLTRIMGLDISQEETARLADLTEGWIAGLQIAALAMQKSRDPSGFVSNFTGTQKHIMSYLTTEVLRQQPEEVRSFLLDTSILNHLSASLCDEVTGRKDSQRMLERAEAANLFIVPLDEEHRWYRYHHLFADSLTNQLEKTNSERVRDLHGKASRWYEKNGNVNDAIRHAISARDEKRAADLLEGYAEKAFYRSERATLRSWLETLPEDLLQARPILCVGHAWTLMSDRNEDAYRLIDLRLHDAEESLRTGKGSRNGSSSLARTQKERILGYAVAIRGHAARERGDPAELVIDYSKTALDHLSERDLDLRSTVLFNLALGYLQSGDTDAALRTLGETKAIARKTGVLYMEVFTAYIQARTTLFSGRLREAASLLQENLESVVWPAESAGTPVPIGGALHICLAAIQVEQNLLAEAESSLDKGLKQTKLTAEPGVLIQGHGTLVRLQHAQGKPLSEIMVLVDEIVAMERFRAGAARYAAALRINLLLAGIDEDPTRLTAAESCADAHGLDLHEEEIVARHFQEAQWHLKGTLALARLRIAQARGQELACRRECLEPVLTFLDRQLATSDAKGMGGPLIEMLILQALACRELNLADEAMSSLERALGSAEREGYVRIFAEEGEPMAELLGTAISGGISADYSATLLESIQGTPSSRSKRAEGRRLPLDAADPLSSRELEVLRLLANGLSNREIAQELFVSMSTAKTHVHRIYSKLNVHKRTQAVEKARKVGYL